MVPELAGDRETLAAETTEGMLRLAAEMKRARPDTIVIATPHNLRLLRKIGVVIAENSSGRVVAGDKSISLEVRCDVELALELLSSAEESGIPVVGANYGTESGPLSNLAMDWGTLIPLWFFLRLNRLRSKIVIVTPSREIPLKENYRFGVKVAELAERGKKRVAFVASSDQAHAHAKTGPYGYSPKAAVYDRRVVEAIKGNRLADILKFDPSLVDEAKPDSLWQMTMLAGALSQVGMTGRLYSYEVAGYFGMLCAGYTKVRA
jgi:aromatic ring-opening dioxygenase LigB subunit